MTWLQTLSGAKWPLLDPAKTDVNFAEIAHCLSVLPRFVGHTNPGYSVAEHCVYVHDFVLQQGYPEPYALWGLLHDAHEFTIGDFATPVQSALCVLAEEKTPGGAAIVQQAITRLKQTQDKAIFDAANLYDKIDQLDPRRPLLPRILDCRRAVKDADMEVLLAERDQLLATPPEPWANLPDRPAHPSIKIQKWIPIVAKMNWLNRFCARTEFSPDQLQTPKAA